MFLPWISHECTQFSHRNSNCDKSILIYSLLYIFSFRKFSLKNVQLHYGALFALFTKNYTNKSLPRFFAYIFNEIYQMLCANVITMLTFMFVLWCECVYKTKLKSLTCTFVTSLDEHLINGNSCETFHSCES